MTGLRIWHLLAMTAAAAVLFALHRFDRAYNACSPLAPVLAASYLCSVLGLAGALWRVVRRGGGSGSASCWGRSGWSSRGRGRSRRSGWNFE